MEGLFAVTDDRSLFLSSQQGWQSSLRGSMDVYCRFPMEHQQSLADQIWIPLLWQIDNRSAGNKIRVFHISFWVVCGLERAAHLAKGSMQQLHTIQGKELVG